MNPQLEVGKNYFIKRLDKNICRFADGEYTIAAQSDDEKRFAVVGIYDTELTDFYTFTRLPSLGDEVEAVDYSGEPEIQWLTLDEINVAAQAGDIPAMDSSIEHWTQGVTATREQLIKAYRENKFNVSRAFCALCLRYDGKRDKCPAWDGNTFTDYNEDKVFETHDCFSVYEEARQKFFKMLSGGDKEFAEWQEKAWAVVDYLKAKKEEMLEKAENAKIREAINNAAIECPAVKSESTAEEKLERIGRIIND